LTAHRHRAIRAASAVLLAAILLLLGANTAHGQQPTNRVWLPVVQHGAFTAKLAFIFLEDPGVYWKVIPDVPEWPPMTDSSVFYTQDGTSRYTSVHPIEHNQWYYTPLVHQWPGVYRLNRWIRVNGLAFAVRSFHAPPEGVVDIKLYDPHD